METLAVIAKKADKDLKEEIQRAIINGPCKSLQIVSKIKNILKQGSLSAYAFKINTIEDAYIKDLVILHLAREGYKAGYSDGYIWLNF